MRAVAMYLLLILLINACKKADDRTCWKGWGMDMVSYREKGAFDEIRIHGHLEVHLILSNTPYVEVKGGSHVINEVKAEVSNKTLEIDNLNACNFLRGYKKQIVVTIGAPEINHITYSGTGPVVCDDTLITEKLKVETVSGSGDLQLLAHCDSIDIIMHASVSGINIRGDCHFLYAYSSGQSVLNAVQFQADSAIVHHRGIGDMEIRVSKHLNISIESLGDVYVTGHPGIGWDVESGEGRLFLVQ